MTGAGSGSSSRRSVSRLSFEKTSIGSRDRQAQLTLDDPAGEVLVVLGERHGDTRHGRPERFARNDGCTPWLSAAGS